MEPTLSNVVGRRDRQRNLGSREREPRNITNRGINYWESKDRNERATIARRWQHKLRDFTYLLYQSRRTSKVQVFRRMVDHPFVSW
jgi:hypothetical protein